ncbi:MAG: family 16 glycosylhydrolase, partial [Trueperaceae bacterium]
MSIKRAWSLLIIMILGLSVFLSPCFGGRTVKDLERIARQAQPADRVLADFEGGPPAGWFDYNGGASSVAAATQVVADGDPLALPGQVGDNEILETTFTIGDFGGFGQDFATGLGGPQDWSGFDGVGFWFYGNGSGLSYQFEIMDNRSDPSTDTAERFDYNFTDDFTGWRFVTIPFASFTRATDFQPGGAPNDGLGLTEMWGWAVVLPFGTDSFYLDHVGLVGGEVPLKVAFQSVSYTVEEGDTATITVALTTASSQQVAVDYATSDGTATDGDDYSATSGPLVFPAGTVEQSFTVTTVDDNDDEPDETVILTLSNPVNAELGANFQTTLKIKDNELPTPGTIVVIDDFESGLPVGADGDGNAIGFFTFNDGNSTVAINTGTPPASVPGSVPGNQVLQVDTHVNDSFGFAGMIHAFENPAVNEWTPQDWSGFEGFSFWLFGNNTGSILFIDILDNRVPGSTSDTAERFSIDIVDDFSGWKFFAIPFADLSRKEIGNGAPNDGFTLSEVHGWAFGGFNSGLPFTNYLDDVGVFGAAEPPQLAVTFSANEYQVDEGDTATVTVKLNRPLGAEDPPQVGVSYSSDPGTARPDREYGPVAGTLTFVQGGPAEQTFSLPTFDDPKHDGDKTVILRLTDPVDVSLGFVTQAVVAILDGNPLDPGLVDDFERGAFLWAADDQVAFGAYEVAAGDPLALPGQGAYENLLRVTVPLVVDMVVEGRLCKGGTGVIPVALLKTDSFDATSVDHTSVRFGTAFEAHGDRKTGVARRHEEDFEGDGDTDLIFHFRARETGYDCDTVQPILTGETFGGQPILAGGEAGFGFGRDFAIGRDWSAADGLSFWFYGTGSGVPVTVGLKDNRAPDPGPPGWELVWSDEFDDAAGTPPDPENWSYELGDGAVNRIPGWGNQELQYYTDSTDNVAHDGNGNLVITTREADGSLLCYYGPCSHTSARLISWYKAEFAYGRIESRIKVPQGAGLWPAFWSLGTDIGEVGWPQTGEIDIMEFVGRLPNEVFGTIHGPGYSGGQSFGNINTFGEPVYNDFHTFAIEWQPDRIDWYVDGIPYHSATPADVAPNEWVFNDPVFLLLNTAIGGNFGGPLGP